MEEEEEEEEEDEITTKTAMQQSCTFAQDNCFFAVNKEEKEKKEKERGVRGCNAAFRSNAAELCSWAKAIVFFYNEEGGGGGGESGEGGGGRDQNKSAVFLHQCSRVVLIDQGNCFSFLSSERGEGGENEKVEEVGNKQQEDKIRTTM